MDFGKQIRTREFVFPEVDELIKMKILESNSLQALRNVQISGEATSLDIVSVYCERAWTVGKNLCMTADECFVRALDMAKERDSLRERYISEGKDLNEALPPLHGIPFSVKDHIYVQGTYCTVGAVTSPTSVYTMPPAPSLM